MLIIGDSSIAISELPLSTSGTYLYFNPLGIPGQNSSQ